MEYTPRARTDHPFQEMSLVAHKVGVGALHDVGKKNAVVRRDLREQKRAKVRFRLVDPHDLYLCCNQGTQRENAQRTKHYKKKMEKRKGKKEKRRERKSRREGQDREEEAGELRIPPSELRIQVEIYSSAL